MRVLVAAYSCDPYRGSEAGVGWRALQRIAARHEVCALVNRHNQEGWERAREAGLIPAGVRVRFVAGGVACSPNRLVARAQSWLNYATFQRKLLGEALAWHREEKFDLCHQITIASWRIPSPLWRMPIPLVWGPIGGAGRMPGAFRGSLGTAARAFEALRDANTWVSSRRKAFRDCVRRAAVVIAANAETAAFLAPFRGDRPLLELPIASFPPEVVAKLRRPGNKPPAREGLRLFAGGNMIGTKGLAYALRALRIVADRGVAFHYTIAGGGPAIEDAKALSEGFGLNDSVEFHPGFRGDDYTRVLQESDVYLLPSFRESTPVTMLEAMLAGCYPVVADTSAQGEIARLCGGAAVPIDSPDTLVEGLAEAVCRCADAQRDLRAEASAIAESVARQFSSETYDRTLDRVYAEAVGAGEC